MVTFWEISLKAGLGKLSFTRVNPEDYPALVLESGWSIHPLSAEVAASAGRLPRVPDHRDPFDRMLAWTAIQEGFSLVSGDAAFRDYAPHGLKVCW